MVRTNLNAAGPPSSPCQLPDSRTDHVLERRTDARLDFGQHDAIGDDILQQRRLVDGLDGVWERVCV